MKQSNQIQLFRLIRKYNYSLRIKPAEEPQIDCTGLWDTNSEVCMNKRYFGKIKMKRIESQHDEIQEIHC